MKHSEKLAPVAAVFSALLSLLCCLPLAIPAAAGLAGLSSLAGAVQPFLLVAAVLLLAIGGVQLARNRECRRRSPASVAILALAATVLAPVTLFPQSVAALLAGLPANRESRLSELTRPSLETLKQDFNQAAGRVRIIVLLSPT